MFIADSHCDTLYALNGGLKIDELMINREKMLKGGLCLQTFALFTGGRPAQKTAYLDGIDMLGQAEKLGIPVYTKKLPDEPPMTPSGIVSIEGGEALEGSLERLHELYDLAGIRMIALTWNYENEIGYPAKMGPEKGLKPFGIELLKKMDKLGIYADVSHLNEAGFWDVYEYMELPPIASHSNNRELCDVPRNLYKKQIEAIIERKGYIGINFYTNFLTRTGKSCINDMIRHIDSIAELGGMDCLGFGSDFDGIELWPNDMYDCTCYPALIDALLAHGYTEEQVAKMSGLNLWELLKKAELRRGY